MEEPDRQPDSPQRPARPRRNAPVLLLVLGLVAIIALVLGTNSGNTLKVDVYQVDKFVDDGKVANITIFDGKRVVGEFRDSAEEAKKHKKFEVTYAGPPENSLLDADRLARWRDRLGADGKLEQKESNSLLSQMPSILLWVGILVLFWFLILRQMGRVGGQNVSQFGRSRARLATKERSTVTFDDVAGVEEAEDEVSEIVAFLKSPQKFKKIGARIPRGVMLVGPPGCGKTLLAKAIAGEAGVPFFSVSGSDFVEMFVGVGASRVRDLFKQARENSPCIVFLDEIDAVGRRRGTGLGGGHDEREQTLNQILVEMDGFDTDQGIILLAATNRPDVLDPALLRPGRFDRNIVINLPDVKGREQILRIHSRKVKMSPSADLAKGRDRVTMHDMEEARDKIRFGRSRKSMIMSDKQREITAYHEAGHTIVNVLEEKADPLHKVTIIPRGMALGVTMMLPDEDRYGMSRGEMIARLRVAYGGRIAEDMIFGDITNGAQNDIEQATEMARLMVTKWGMSEAVGPVSYAEGEEHLFLGREVSRTVNHSEETAQLIDTEVKRLLEEAYASASKTLEENQDGLHALAKALLKYETLDADEVAAVLRGDSVEAVRASKPDATPPPPPASEPSAESRGEVSEGGGPAEGFAY